MLIPRRHLEDLLFCTAILLCGAIALAATASQQPAAAKTRRIQTVRNLSDIRAATGEERVLATHFDRRGEPLWEFGHVELLVGRNENPPVPPPPPGADETAAVPVPPIDTLALVCNFDAIVVGQVVATRTFLNRSETELVTTNTVAVSEWIRPRSGPGTIDIAQSGGVVRVGDRTLSSGRAAVPLLAIETPVLLFAHRMPGASGAFVMHTPGVRLDGAAVVASDLPNGAEELAKTPLLHQVIARLRAKNSTCAGQK